jgi:hypothetical protein
MSSESESWQESPDLEWLQDVWGTRSTLSHGQLSKADEMDLRSASSWLVNRAQDPGFRQKKGTP